MTSTFDSAFARGSILTFTEENVVFVPKEAVVTFAGVSKLFTVDKDKAVERRVQLGRREGELVQVLKGLAAGESIVAKPGTLVPGQTVRIATR